jgi:hypothetical protein
MRLRRLLLAAVAWLFAPPAVGEPETTGVRYVAADDVVARLRALESDRAKATTYGKSAMGRDLWVMRVGRPDLPQVLVHGGLGARDAAGTAAALDLVLRLLSRDDPSKPDPLERVGFLVIPAPNPDALTRFLSPESASPLGSNVDRDRDGRRGEDGPDDLDGDGQVLWMRRRDPGGSFASDDAPEKDGKRMGDPRILRDAGVDARRAASYARLEEGRDDDGDGEVNEDPAGIDLTRHFPGVWEDVGPWPGDGPFPAFAPEVKALLDLSLETTGLVAWYAFASEGPFLERASERGESAEADKDLYERLAAAWKEASGLETKKASERGSQNAGSELDWASRHLGLVAVRVPVWRIAKQEGNGRERAAADELDWLLWDDARGGKGFVPWKEVAHPTLGPVEVGGWRRFTRWEPPHDLLEAAVRQVALLPAVHADFAPRLAVGVEVEALGGSLFQVKARARNVGGGPSDTKSAEKAQRHMPVRLAFRPAAGTTVEAGTAVSKAGVLAPGGVSAPVVWVVRRTGAGDLGEVEAFHRAAGRVREPARTP